MPSLSLESYFSAGDVAACCSFVQFSLENEKVSRRKTCVCSAELPEILELSLYDCIDTVIDTLPELKTKYRFSVSFFGLDKL